jgi:hypothetical protein
MMASEKSIMGNDKGQVFANASGFIKFYPFDLKSKAGDALNEFIQDVGIPAALHTDESKEQTLGKWLKLRKEYGIKQTLTEPHSPFQNRAEGAIRELKKHTRRLMQ